MTDDLEKAARRVVTEFEIGNSELWKQKAIQSLRAALPEEGCPVTERRVRLWRDRDEEGHLLWRAEAQPGTRSSGATAADAIAHLGRTLKIVDEPVPQPAPPEVTREEVEGILRDAEPRHPELARLCRSWLALEEEVRIIRYERDRLRESDERIKDAEARTHESASNLLSENVALKRENAKLRAVAEAAEACHRACPDPSQCVLCTALRRWKSPEETTGHGPPAGAFTCRKEGE